MKTELSLISKVVGLSLLAIMPAQAVMYEVVPKIGYAMHTSKDLAGPTYDQLKLDSDALYGLSIGFINNEADGQLEVSWSHSNTTARIEMAGGNGPDKFDVGVDQIHLNGLFLTGSGSWQPYGLLGLGATHYSAERHSDHLRFSFALGGGGKWLWNDHLGLRFEGKWIPMLAPQGTHFFCPETGAGGCPSTEANSYFARQFPFISTFEFTTGIVLRY